MNYPKHCRTCVHHKVWVQDDLVYCKRNDCYMRYDGICKKHEQLKAYRSLETHE